MIIKLMKAPSYQLGERHVTIPQVQSRAGEGLRAAAQRVPRTLGLAGSEHRTRTLRKIILHKHSPAQKISGFQI